MLLARRLPGRSPVAQQIMPSMSVKVLKPSSSGDSFLALFRDHATPSYDLQIS